MKDINFCVLLGDFKLCRNSPKVVFSPYFSEKRFFRNWAMSLLYPCGALAMSKSRETAARSLKTDHPPTNRHR